MADPTLMRFTPIALNCATLSFSPPDINTFTGFGATALAIVIVLTVVYGLGFLFAALVIFIPAAILIGVFPFLAPFILMGLGLWWLLTRRSNRA